MKLSKHRKSRRFPAATQTLQVPADAVPSLPALVASMFTRLRLAHRVRVLRRLLMPVGPMALAVLSGGVFAKYVAQARWPQLSVSVEDAARVTSSQVFELVRYVEQSDPQVLQQVVEFLSRDTTTMAAVGASVTALVMQHLSTRKAARRRSTPRPA
jgi:glycerol-3-phosphate dehydrogenase